MTDTPDKLVEHTPNTEAECPSCGGLNLSCPGGCGRDANGELNGTRLNTDAEGLADNAALIRRVEYILDPSASAKQRLERRAHLTNHDLRCILATLSSPPEVDVERVARQLDLLTIYNEARERMICDMTGENFDFHLVRVAGEHAARAALTAMKGAAS
jgi:hypothetical protein